MRPFLFPLLALALPAAAQQVPMCLPQRGGMVGCFDGRLCLCRFEPGGQLTGRPDGHRWDCGPLRPDCRPAPFDTPWAAPPWPSFLPPPQILLTPDATRR